jgi:ATP-dependent Lon protease
MQLKDYEKFPTKLPVLVDDELFFYPFMISPIFVNSKSDIKAIESAMENNSLLFVTTTKPNAIEDRSFDKIYKVGVVGSIMRRVELNDGRVKILFQGLAKAKILADESIEDDKLVATIDIVKNEEYQSVRVDALISLLREKIKQLSQLSSSIPSDLIKTIEESSEPHRVADLISSMLELDKEQAYSLYIKEDIEERLLGIIDVVAAQIEALKIQKDISNRVHSNIEKTNKEYFLKEQLKEIQRELGADAQRDEEINGYKEALSAIKETLSEDAYAEIDKQIDRYSKVHPDSADASLLQNYLELVFELPFGKYSKGSLSIKKVANELDADHYSLKKPKERIVEFFSVKELAELRGKIKESNDGVILCFAGPPGVGKTSLANSISKALNRPLVRLALGGLEDVNELRGHRRTYIGAMPGRVVQGLIEAKTMDPVIVLDEIDKVGRSNRGDPTAALLEILDPEQNAHYRDYYLNFAIDLSKVIFIATANQIGYIPAPLRDRMEIIFVSSYTPNEKFEIAKRYLIPQELKKHALRGDEVSIGKKALKTLIDEYTREPGVRNLRRKIAMIARKAAKEILENPETTSVKVSYKNLKEYAGKKVFEYSPIATSPEVGVVNGLAWTSVGGDVLTIEVIKIKGKGQIQLTGSLGDVMKESARIAQSVVKILIDNKELSIDNNIIPKTTAEKEKNIVPDVSEVYKRYDLHIHVPEGATPKDGPSAGITMATAIASIYTNRKIDNKVAMTGELTLTGKVLPIGGLKEKLIAAYKSGVTKALIPRKNYELDLEEIPEEILDNMTIIPVDRVEEVLAQALV